MVDCFIYIRKSVRFYHFLSLVLAVLSLGKGGCITQGEVVLHCCLDLHLHFLVHLLPEPIFIAKDYRRSHSSQSSDNQDVKKRRKHDLEHCCILTNFNAPLSLLDAKTFAKLGKHFFIVVDLDLFA